MHDIAAHLHRFGELAVKHLSGQNGIAILLLSVHGSVRRRGDLYPHEPGHMVVARLRRASPAERDISFRLGASGFHVLAVPQNLHAVLVLPLAISTAAAGHVSYRVLTGIFGAPAHPAAPAGPLLLVAFTVTMLIAYDLSYYLFHRMQHGIPLLWELHKVHHSAQVMIGVHQGPRTIRSMKS